MAQSLVLLYILAAVKVMVNVQVAFGQLIEQPIVIQLADDEGGENAEEEEVEEEEAMQQSCTRGPWQLFPPSEQGVREEEEEVQEEEENNENEEITLQSVFRSNGSKVYSRPKAIVSFH